MADVTNILLLLAITGEMAKSSAFITFRMFVCHCTPFLEVCLPGSLWNVLSENKVSAHEVASASSLVATDALPFIDVDHLLGKDALETSSRTKLTFRSSMLPNCLALGPIALFDIFWVLAFLAFFCQKSI